MIWHERAQLLCIHKGHKLDIIKLIFLEYDLDSWFLVKQQEGYKKVERIPEAI